MKSFIKYLCLYLICLLPLTTQAKPTDQVIFKHPKNSDELWQTDMWHTHNARLIFQHNHAITEFAVQRDDPNIAFIAGYGIEEISECDVYLIDRNHPDKKALNLTQREFEEVWDLDISIHGDIVFTNVPTGENLVPKTGIFLIPNSEIKKQKPKIRRLTNTEARELVWSPGGEQIAYSTNEGVFTLDIATQRITHVSEFGWYPAFSPDGKKLTFSTGRSIYIVPLGIRGGRKIIALDNSGKYINWSPNGDYITYATVWDNFAVSINGGHHIQIFEEFEKVVSFDWVHSEAYPVDPRSQLTTLWGKLKTHNLK